MCVNTVFKAIIFCIFVPFGGYFTVWNDPKHNTEVLPRGPKQRKVVMFLTEMEQVWRDIYLLILEKQWENKQNIFFLSYLVDMVKTMMWRGEGRKSDLSEGNLF